MTTALAALKTRDVKWDVEKARRADVTCDGLLDTIMFGTGKDSIWVGIAPGGSGKSQIMKFSASRDRQDGFAGPPIRIDIYPINCQPEDGMHLDGCKFMRKCKEFSIENEADPFNFYWDSRNKTIRWWRN